MAHREDGAKEVMQDVTEEQFLKNLYVFMKKRDTPIERIPNLGFKQSTWHLSSLHSCSAQTISSSSVAEEHKNYFKFLLKLQNV